MPSRALKDLLRRGPRTAAELRGALDVSAATLSRLVAAESEVLRLGRGRATTYALVRPIRGLPSRLHVYRVDARGKAGRAAELHPLEGGSTWLQGKAHSHLFAGLPPVVHDMVPAGYLGRRFSEEHPDLELPTRLLDWIDDHRLMAVARRGEDLPGDLIIGDESLDRFLATPLREVEVRDYPQLAVASALGGAGPSAGGEHPKFAAFRDGRHFLVKFTAGDGSPSDWRWRDLLVCEHLALEVLASGGCPAAQTRIVDQGSQRFLESERFDRIGSRGRRGVLTLGPLDDDLFRYRDSWTNAAERLQAEKLLPEEHARRIRLLEAFGIWILNGDRHFGNISFIGDALEQRPSVQLAPAYDMLPMDLAPRAGLLPAMSSTPPVARASLIDVWDEATTLAVQFWTQVMEDTRISPEFRRVAGLRVSAAS